MASKGTKTTEFYNQLCYDAYLIDERIGHVERMILNATQRKEDHENYRKDEDREAPKKNLQVSEKLDDAVKNKSTNIEDLFVEVYGNNNSSGLWRCARDMQESPSMLKKVCSQAHTAAKFWGKVGAAGFDTRTLDLQDSEKYKLMNVDVLIYGLEGLEIPEGTPNYFYITKGRTSECVHYLVPFDPDAMVLGLGEHVCGIDIESVKSSR